MLGKFIGMICILVCAGLLTGCSSLLKSQKQEIMIATVNDKIPEKTRCLLKNEEGLWKVMPNTKALILRDENALEVQCVNSLQVGKEYVTSNFNEGGIAFGMLLLCALCPYDIYYNTWFWYAPYVIVLMKDKKDMEFIQPLLLPGNAK